MSEIVKTLRYFGKGTKEGVMNLMKGGGIVWVTADPEIFDRAADIIEGLESELSKVQLEAAHEIDKLKALVGQMSAEIGLLQEEKKRVINRDALNEYLLKKWDGVLRRLAK
jgi:hypothetical protein